MSDIDRFVKLYEFIVPHSEAYDLISSLERTLPGAYQDAWRMLCEQYDDPRRQVNEIINKFLSMKGIQPTREGLLRVFNGINNLTNMLPRLGVDVSTWDPILMTILENKIDFTTFDQWRRERNPREIAKLEPFVQFLRREIDRRSEVDHSTTDQSNHSRNNQPRPNRSQAPWHNRSSSSSRHENNENRPANNRDGAVGGRPKVKSAIKRPLKCPLCKLEHGLYIFPTFNRYDLHTMRECVDRIRVCRNCLKPNCSPEKCTLRPCLNAGCGAKHNTLLCELTYRPTVNMGTTA